MTSPATANMSRSTHNANIPRRRPLHERSASHTNEVMSPTLRVVDDAAAEASEDTIPASHAHTITPFSEAAPISQSTVTIPAPTAYRPESMPDPSKRPLRSRPSERRQKWNPHLSTVHSEGWVERQSGASTPLAPPAPVRTRSRDVTGSTIRVVTEEDDDRPTQKQPRKVRSRPSGLLAKISSQSMRRKAQNAGEMRTEIGSRGSFLRDSIPAWARYAFPTPTESPCTDSYQDSLRPGFFRFSTARSRLFRWRRQPAEHLARRGQFPARGPSPTNPAARRGSRQPATILLGGDAGPRGPELRVGPGTADVVAELFAAVAPRPAGGEEPPLEGPKPRRAGRRLYFQQEEPANRHVAGGIHFPTG